MICKTDKNQRDIVQALREVGTTVISLHEVGKGCPDLLVGYKGKNYLIEIKNKSGKLTPRQEKFNNEWRGKILIFRTIDDVIKFINKLDFF